MITQQKYVKKLTLKKFKKMQMYNSLLKVIAYCRVLKLCLQRIGNQSIYRTSSYGESVIVKINCFFLLTGKVFAGLIETPSLFLQLNDLLGRSTRLLLLLSQGLLFFQAQ